LCLRQISSKASKASKTSKYSRGTPLGTPGLYLLIVIDSNIKGRPETPLKSYVAREL